MAAGTRTAPDATTTATAKNVSYHLIDETGDTTTVSVYAQVATTAAQIEAMGDALQAASQASLYKITVSSVWSANPDKNDASTGNNDSVFDNVVTLVKSPTPRSAFDWYIPAPIQELLVPGSDNIDPASTELAAVYTALLAMVPAGYGIIQARFSEHKEVNKAVKI